MIEAAITKAALRTGVNRNALERLVYNESRGNPNIGMDISNYSAGIAQLSRKVWNSHTNLPYSDAAKPQYYEENLEIGAQYLKENYHRFGSWRLALAAYNEGPTIVNKVLRHQRELSPITQKYIAGINY